MSLTEIRTQLWSGGFLFFFIEIYKFLVDKLFIFEYNKYVNGTRCGRKLTIIREFFLYLMI